MRKPSGEQFEIAEGETRAIVTEVGATLRRFAVGEGEVLWGFEASETCSGGRGQVLAPWPNRLADGSYEFAGRRGQAPLDEPERHNAIHGLVRWQPWQIERLGAASVRASVRIAPQPAYPWWVRLGLVYAVSPGELTVEATAENLDEVPAPFAIGFHPYLEPGAGGVDASTVGLPARRRLVLDERGLPIGAEALASSPLEAVTTGVRLDEMRLDDCFSDLVSGGDGRWEATFVPRGGPVVTVWADSVFSYLMCFTGDSLPDRQRRRAVAIEPMTAPPNALASGESLQVLEAGTTFRATWGISVGAA